MLIFLVTNLVVLPVAIAFFFDDVGTHWIIFNVTCDTLFILDIFVNFRTGNSFSSAFSDWANTNFWQKYDWTVGDCLHVIHILY